VLLAIKIEILKIYFYFTKMVRLIKFWNLEPGREYFIERNGQRYKDKVIFSSLHGPRHFHDFGSSESAWFIHRGFNIEFERDDEFYDVEEIKEKAQKARQQMECRALNQILKQIVNETFEW
jgi:hypothetical protein